jgi:SAM-dependent methyltransferase
MVIIRAIDETPIYFRGLSGNAFFYAKKASLPDCLESEKTGYFDHVHFHMINDNKWHCAPEIFSGISRLLKEGGIFFFSGDANYFGHEPLFADDSTKWISDALDRSFSGVFTIKAFDAIRAVHHMASKTYDVLYATGWGNYASEDQFLTLIKKESSCIASLFKASAVSPRFFRLFSEFESTLLQYSYFLIARKKAPEFRTLE